MECFITGLIIGLVIGAVALYLYMPKVAKKKIDNFLMGLITSNVTIKEFLFRHLAAEEAERFVCELKRKMSVQIFSRISEQSVSDSAAHMLVAQVSTRLTSGEEHESQQGFFGKGKDMLKNLVKGHVEEMVQNNKDYVEQILSNKIHDVIVQNGEVVVANIVSQEIDSFLSRPLSSLFQGDEDMLDELKQQFGTILKGKN